MNKRLLRDFAILEKLTELANIADKIEKQIDQRIEAVATTPVVIPKDFLGRDDIAWVQNISADTVFPTQFESWTDDQQHTLDDISKQLDTEKVTSDLQLFRSQIGIIKPILEDLITANKAIKASELAEAWGIKISNRWVMILNSVLAGLMTYSGQH